MLTGKKMCNLQKTKKQTQPNHQYESIGVANAKKCSIYDVCYERDHCLGWASNTCYAKKCLRCGDMNIQYHEWEEETERKGWDASRDIDIPTGRMICTKCGKIVCTQIKIFEVVPYNFP